MARIGIIHVSPLRLSSTNKYVSGYFIALTIGATREKVKPLVSLRTVDVDCMKKLIVCGLVVAGTAFAGGLFLYNNLYGGLCAPAVILLGLLAFLGGSLFVIMASLTNK